MKRIIYLLLIVGVFGLTAFGQGPKGKAAALPARIAELNGEDADKLVNDPLINARLRTLLGKKGYASFMESFETVTPVTKDGDILFASGCMIHACTHLESAIAVDLKNNTVHAAIFNDEKPRRFFNERGRRTPKPISDWANHLTELKAPLN